MHLPTTRTTTTSLLLLLLYHPFLTTATPANSADYTLARGCGLKNPSINAAISAFCQPPDTLVVPSRRAANGATRNGIRVSVRGNCQPPQWVPLPYCLLQFHEICATVQTNGLGVKRFGNGGCQAWRIERVKGRKRDVEEGEEGESAEEKVFGEEYEEGEGGEEETEKE